MKLLNKERGSLALEQVLFIGAIVLMSVGLVAFYQNIATYFQGVQFSTPASNLG